MRGQREGTAERRRSPGCWALMLQGGKSHSGGWRTAVRRTGEVTTVTHLLSCVQVSQVNLSMSSQGKSSNFIDFKEHFKLQMHKYYMYFFTNQVSAAETDPSAPLKEENMKSETLFLYCTCLLNI